MVTFKNTKIIIGMRRAQLYGRKQSPYIELYSDLIYLSIVSYIFLTSLSLGFGSLSNILVN
jgi:hypothetical protein